MKKSLIALSVAGLIAGSASAATIYNNDGTKFEISGSARVMLNKISDHPAEKDNRLDLQNDGSRIKFKFSQQIGDGFSALGFVELRPGDANFSGGINTKYLYAGFQADDVGTLTFGKQKTAGDAFRLADPAEQDYNIVDALGIPKESQKVINFTSANYGGFGLQASYLFDLSAAKSGSEGYEHKKNNIDPNYNGNRNGYQILVKYENTFDDVGLKVHALYSHEKHDPEKFTMPERGMRAQMAWGLGAAINVADFGFAVDYGETKITSGFYNKGSLFINNRGEKSLTTYHKIDGLTAALTYQLFDPMDIYVVYQHYRYHKHPYYSHTVFGTDLSYMSNNWIVGTHYYLNKNVMTYLEYARMKDTDYYGFAPDNRVYLGLRVFF